MPTATCETCGSQTNSACSNFWEHNGQKTTKCYAAYQCSSQQWKKGCGFDGANYFNKAYAMSLITGKDIMNFLKKGKRNG